MTTHSPKAPRFPKGVCYIIKNSTGNYYSCDGPFGWKKKQQFAKRFESYSNASKEAERRNDYWRAIQSPLRCKVITLKLSVKES